MAAAAALLAVLVVNHWTAVRRAHAMTCLYTRGGISGLRSAERALGVSAACTLAFDGGSTWASWSAPWFVDSSIPNNNWSSWVSERAGRHLVADVDLIPTSESADSNWRALGAAGAFVRYDSALAAALVKGGLGHSFIRLGNEGNGSWEPDWIGSSPADWSLWRTFWRRTAFAMRSVPGAHFRFVWCISPGIGHVPLSAYYPGNDVVSVIGLDIYDSGLAYSGSDRWDYLMRVGGVDAVLQFAAAAHKPVAVPEWGLIPAPPGGGDDPNFVRGIASLSARRALTFQGYFDAGSSASALATASRSVAAYREAFGSASGS